MCRFPGGVSLNEGPGIDVDSSLPVITRKTPACMTKAKSGAIVFALGKSMVKMMYVLSSL